MAGRDPSIPVIVISAGTCGQASGANDLIRIAKRELLAKKLTEKIHLRITGCHGFCETEPSALIEPRRTFYPNIDSDDMGRIVKAVAAGDVIEDLLYKDPETGNPVEKQDDIPFYKRQVRTILSRNEKVDPIRIYNYFENGGYSALSKALTKGSPEWVLNQVKVSKLRGRGGAGFPTGLKWELLAQARNGARKFLVCNADEGDPGAYMDRSVLEANPHSVIEGMLIGAYGTRATEGVIYVRNEYPLAIKHLVIALRQACDLGLLGENILGTQFSFNIRLVKGAGAFVCGEETALMRSIEGVRPEPRQRPPYPVEKGIDSKPTVINNVETWANIPLIISNGAKQFAKVGTENNTGTKIFSLVGKIRNTGLAEVPMGITIGEIIYDIGGGPSGKAKIKAVQTGGPSGGCIPASRFDLPIDYDSLTEAGSIMGSGGMIAMDENTCMVDVTKYFMSFLKDESCGKCFTCRKGTQRMYEILDDISKGNATVEKLDLLEELAQAVKDTSMCGLGQSACNPVLSTLHYFRDEYIEHIKDKRCSAAVCKELVGAPCQSTCPVGTEAWRYIAHIQRGEYEEAYRVIREPNPFPSVCARVCHHPCEDKCRAGTSGGQAIAIRALKRLVTDRIDPATYKPKKLTKTEQKMPQVAVVGSGPAGLSTAHYLSLRGYKVTVFEAEDRPGGMLLSGIPGYRLPREVLRKEIDSLIDENVTLKAGTALGRDMTIDSLFDDGFKAIFLALGAHKSRRMDIQGEDLEGVYPAMQFLKAFNLRGKKLAKGRVGVIGGGNSAIDAARVALRQEGVESVTVIYRRTPEEMPAFEEEVEAAQDEGIELKTLLSPTRICTKNGHLSGMECIRNELGKIDSSGRRRPVPVPGTEHTIYLDTLIVAIGEQPDVQFISAMGVEINKRGTLHADPETLATSRPGVFAGGDVVTGPNTVIDAIAAGKKAAVVIDRYLRGEELRVPPKVHLPEFYLEPATITEDELAQARRAKPSTLPAESRRQSFEEVEKTLSIEDGLKEARRCLRCDLEFTQQEEETEGLTGGEEQA
ncbi:FAD-dependent oxidoreductase [candidate division TA06 bacterium]|uniref:FAD-dependent oxidoreductase n=1 Tax=candidate division TA06 bacterium TaxID=2250710 RepID=A0A523UNC0_UNCT6|nr:MAG: FAD-dependent oxidoreductase [candidate division TA06 bacterium]